MDRIARGFVEGRCRECVWVWGVGEEEGRGGLDLAGVVVVNHPCTKEGGGSVVCTKETWRTQGRVVGLGIKGIVAFGLFFTYQFVR